MPKGRPLDVEHELVEVFKQNGLVNEYLITVVPPALWRINPPVGRGRSIAAIVAHMQSVRRTFARMGGARPGPPSLDRKSSTPQQAQRALHQSTEDLARLFDTAFAARRARVKGMPRRERRVEQADRKSTRLNSSHLGISYAVFCLKK